LHEPELLILDEPTNGLDPAGIREFRELLIRLRTESDITILLSSHLLAEIEQMATHVGVINDGKLLFEGTLEQLKRTQPTELTLRVDTPDKAMTVLRQIGVTAKQVDAAMTCNVQDDMHAALVVAALVRHGIQVYECHRTNGSLESIFIGLTEPESKHGNR
jgi:ABC-2 type transport system ATP-binding protein